MRSSWLCCTVGHACCTAADEPPPVVLVSLPLRASLSIAQGACSYTSPAPVGLAAMGRGVSFLHAGPTGVLESCPPHSLLPPPGCSRSRCTSWERGRHELGQTREGLEGGWEEGGEKGGRDEGWREEEEVRRGWREGCGEGFDWWMGGGRGVEEGQIINKRFETLFHFVEQNTSTSLVW